MVKTFIALCIALGVTSMVSASPQGTKEPHAWLMFFTKGKTPASKDESVSQEMMKGHFENMKKRANEGVLFTAGPLKDPKGEKRGITVVWATSSEEVASYFKDDPFVKAGIMGVEAHPWSVKKTDFHPEVNPESLGEFRIVFLKRGKGMRPETPSQKKAHDEAIAKFIKENGSGVMGDLTLRPDLKQAFIVGGTDELKIKVMLEKSPLVRSQILEFEIMPLWMSKDVLGKRD